MSKSGSADMLRAEKDGSVRAGKTAADQQRNAQLQAGYDYSKYLTYLTGYTGQDMQRVLFCTRQHAARVLVGPRGNYKGGMARLPNGKLVIGLSRDNNDADPSRRRFFLFVYESSDKGLTWTEIGKTTMCGTEPSMTALPDGTLVLTAQMAYWGPDAKYDDMPVYRSTDGGRNWDTIILSGNGDYPRNLILEPDGSLMMIRAKQTEWWKPEGASPNLEIGRSKDGGRTWTFTEGIVDWDFCMFGEVSAIRLKNGKLLAAMRYQVPCTEGEGFESTVITESADDGRRWSKPRQMMANAEVHVYLTQLKDGRILATYSNYHLPWGVSAVVSKDDGKTWDLDHPIQLSVSQDVYFGWPVTLQLPNGELITCYANTSYMKEAPLPGIRATTTCQAVSWKLPNSNE